MTTARRAAVCPSCGFARDHMIHYRNCVPTSQWPYELRMRKAAAMSHGNDDIMDIDGRQFNAGPIPQPIVEREPEREKPRGLAEYRRLHPEANPLTNEHMTVREFRTRDDGGQDEWDRVVGVREATNQGQPCPRCQRPMLDRALHITCQPLNGDRIPVRGEWPDAEELRMRSAPVPRLRRDEVALTPRHPVIHTTAEVRTGRNWYEGLTEADEPAVDEDEMRDFLGDVSRETDEVPENVDTTLRDRLAAEQAAWAPDSSVDLAMITGGTADADVVHIVPVAPVESGNYANPAPFTCPSCGRVSKSAAGDAAHQRSHARKAE